jgi:hypothetical protein
MFEISQKGWQTGIWIPNKNLKFLSFNPGKFV